MQLFNPPEGGVVGAHGAVEGEGVPLLGEEAELHGLVVQAPGEKAPALPQDVNLVAAEEPDPAHEDQGVGGGQHLHLHAVAELGKVVGQGLRRNGLLPFKE